MGARLSVGIIPFELRVNTSTGRASPLLPPKGSPEEARSRIMRAIPGKDTKPELYLRRLLHSLGYRFRAHRRSLPGPPTWGSSTAAFFMDKSFRLVRRSPTQLICPLRQGPLRSRGGVGPDSPARHVGGVIRGAVGMAPALQLSEASGVRDPQLSPSARLLLSGCMRRH